MGSLKRFIRALVGEPNAPGPFEEKENLQSLVDIETQINVLLYGSALQFACETLGVNNMIDSKYADVFTVSFEEVYQYTVVHGIPQRESSRLDSRIEGFHYGQEDGNWTTFFTERGSIHTPKSFDDDELGKRYIVKTLLQLSGTGLY